MAKEYFNKLSDLITKLKIEDEVTYSLEVKHFFSGAALYADGTICASWSPMGLAFKLPEQEAEDLIAEGKAKPLKYFAKGRTKKGYALFEDPESCEAVTWKKYFLKAAQQV
ncbi:TfoX/Sxy family protein [Gimesia aquarii]|uniref:TfoX N-terminal domain-containing protein n=1 Tax=Gimesia aquarii TaxID=2527964 RepID=A0A517VYZ6_9PLAN|nr:TfoX/Sxy family protein [Gimesia aquarii]QDT98222.1 hypothetical protein V144x_37080 [Gimesia aquarii]